MSFEGFTADDDVFLPSNILSKEHPEGEAMIDAFRSGYYTSPKSTPAARVPQRSSGRLKELDAKTVKGFSILQLRKRHAKRKAAVLSDDSDEDTFSDHTTNSLQSQLPEVKRPKPTRGGSTANFYDILEAKASGDPLPSRIHAERPERSGLRHARPSRPAMASHDEYLRDVPSTSSLRTLHSMAKKFGWDSIVEVNISGLSRKSFNITLAWEEGEVTITNQEAERVPEIHAQLLPIYARKITRLQCMIMDRN